MKKYITILLLMLAALPLAAQNRRTLFVGMPDSIVPLLTQNNRADCVDFIDAKMRAQVSNRLGGKSELLQLTDDYLKMKMSSRGTLEMKLLPRSGGDTLICMVRSVCAEACDSRITFYTKEWTECTDYFEYPRIKEFFNAGDSLGKVLDMADIYLVRLSLSPANADVEATYTMPAYMSQSDSAFVSKYLQKIIYHWDGKKFVRR